MRVYKTGHVPSPTSLKVDIIVMLQITKNDVTRGPCSVKTVQFLCSGAYMKKKILSIHYFNKNVEITEIAHLTSKKRLLG